MNKNIASLLSNVPPSHAIPFDVLQDIRRNGGGMLPSQPISKNAENRIIEYASKKVSVRIFYIVDPQFIYLHIH